MNIKKDITRKYSNDDITVVWKPALCIHSKNCWNGLPGVFDPQQSPWVNISAADSGTIMGQIDKCPSGALSYYKNGEEPKEEEATTADVKVEVMKNGPLLVHGNITVKGKDGAEVQKQKVTALCRCGASENKPYCDGAHNTCGFKDE